MTATLVVGSRVANPAMSGVVLRTCYQGKLHSTTQPHQLSSEDHLVDRDTAVGHHAAVHRRLVVEDRKNRPVVERRMGCIHPVGLCILPVDRTAGAGGVRMLADRTDPLAVGLAEEDMTACRRGTADHSLCAAGLVVLGKNAAGCVGLAPTGCMMESTSSLGRTTRAVGKRLEVPGRCRCRSSRGWSNRSSVLAVTIVSHRFFGNTISYSQGPQRTWPW